MQLLIAFLMINRIQRSHTRFETFCWEILRHLMVLNVVFGGAWILGIRRIFIGRLTEINIQHTFTHGIGAKFIIDRSLYYIVRFSLISIIILRPWIVYVIEITALWLPTICLWMERWFCYGTWLNLGEIRHGLSFLKCRMFDLSVDFLESGGRTIELSDLLELLLESLLAVF